MAPWSNYITAWRAPASTTRYFSCCRQLCRDPRLLHLSCSRLLLCDAAKSQDVTNGRSVLKVRVVKKRPVLKDRKGCHTYICIYVCIIRFSILYFTNYHKSDKEPLEPFLLPALHMNTHQNWLFQWQSRCNHLWRWLGGVSCFNSHCQCYKADVWLPCFIMFGT